MCMRKQKTLKRSVELKGVGIHSGHESRLVLKPAPEDTGIVFILKDGLSNQFIPYHPDYVTDTQNNISVSNGKAVVMTVEHLTAALFAMHVDNCLVECSSSEIPIMDGSSREFIRAILDAGLVDQDKDRMELRVVSPVWSTLDDKFAVMLPSDELRIHYSISFPNSPVGNQVMQMPLNPESFISEVSEARTFGFVEDLDRLREMGLSRGVTMENVQAYSRKEKKLLNGARYDQEPVRHKILDFTGALALLPFDLKGFIICYKSGHTLDVAFMKKIMASLESGRIKPSEGTQDSVYYYTMAEMLDTGKLPA